MTITEMTLCPFCRSTLNDGKLDLEGRLLWQDDFLKVVLVEPTDFIGFCRVIPHDHYTEFSQMDWASRQHMMEVVDIVERTILESLNPKKVNLASLGNVVPHLHWHIIPRYEDDSHFPAPIWGSAQNELSPSQAERIAKIPAFVEQLVTNLRQTFSEVPIDDEIDRDGLEEFVIMDTNKTH